MSYQDDMKAMRLAEERLRAKDRAILASGAAPFGAASKYLSRHCNSHQRPAEILSFKANMNHLDWWRLLGEEWTVCDNVATHTKKLRTYLRKADRTQLDMMMTRYARRQLRELNGGELTVYRGCYDFNHDGLSWSLSERIARKFTTLNRYRRDGHVPLILIGMTDANRAVLKTDRKEQEVICADVKVTSEAEVAV